MTPLGACGPLPRSGLCIYNSGDTYNDRWPLEWSNMLGAVQKANVLLLSKLSLIIVFLFHSLTSLIVEDYSFSLFMLLLMLLRQLKKYYEKNTSKFFLRLLLQVPWQRQV